MSAAISTSLLPRWLKRSLVAIAALLLVLLAIVFGTLALLQVSPGRFEAAIETVTSNLLGRELKIGQLLEVDLGVDSYVLATDVSLANPDWADIPELAAVGRLSIRINLPSIWGDGPIIVHQLELSDVSLALIDSKQHAPTWEFSSGDEGGDVADNRTDVRLSPEAMFPVVFIEIGITNAELIYRDSDQDFLLQIETLALQEPRRGDQVSLDLNGQINGTPLQVRGQFGPVEALITRTNLELDLELVWGELQIQGRGSIGDLMNLSGTDLYLKVSAPQSRPLLDALGVPKLRDGPLQFEGQITDAGPGIALQATGSLVDFDFDVAGKLSRPLTLDGVDMAIKLKGPSLAEVGTMFEIDDLPDLSYQISGEFYRDGASLGLRDTRFTVGEAWVIIDGGLPNFPSIDGWKVKLEGGRLNFALLGPTMGVESLPSTLYDFSADLESTDKGSKLVNLTIHSPVSELVVSSEIGKAPEFLGSRFDARLTGKDLAMTGVWLGLNDLPVQTFEASAKLMLGDTGWKLSNGIFTTADLQLAVSGEMDKFPEPASMGAQIKLSSPDLAAALQTYGFALQGLPAFPASVNATISGAPDRLVIDKAQAEFGNSKLSISGVIGDTRELAGLDLAVKISSPDLLDVLPVVRAATWPALTLDASGQISSVPGGLAIKGLKGDFGGAQGSLAGVFIFEPPHRNSHVVLNTDGPDLSAVLGPWLEHEIPAEPFSISLDADFPDEGLRIRQLEASLGSNHLSGQIEVDNRNDPGNGNGQLQLHGDSSASLAKMLGHELVIPDTDYALNVVVKRSPDWVRFNPISLQLGKTDYAGHVDIRPGDVPLINVDLHSKYVSLLYLLPDLEELAEEEAAAAETSAVSVESVLSDSLIPENSNERIIPDKPLDFGWLNQVQASIKYKADQIQVRPDATSSAAIDISIADGVLVAEQLHWDGSFVNGDAQLTITALEEGADVDVYVDMTRLPIILLLGGEPEYRDDAVYRAQIQTSGASLQEWAAKSNGVIVFKGGGGRLDNTGMSLVLGDVLKEIFSRINPFSQTDPYTEVICHAGAMRINDGMMDVAPGVVLRTTKIDVVSGGSIDLSKEALDMAFNTRGRQGIGINASKAVTPYLKIGGTLANPRLAIDKTGVVIAGSAAIATAGMSYIAEGLWDRWVVTARNPCDNLLTKASSENLKIYQTILEKPSLRDRPVVEAPEN